jgi:hypothetical protein
MAEQLGHRPVVLDRSGSASGHLFPVIGVCRLDLRLIQGLWCLLAPWHPPCAYELDIGDRDPPAAPGPHWQRLADALHRSVPELAGLRHRESKAATQVAAAVAWAEPRRTGLGGRPLSPPLAA